MNGGYRFDDLIAGSDELNASTVAEWISQTEVTSADLATVSRTST